MKLSTSLFIATLASYSLAFPEPSSYVPRSDSGCSVTSNGNGSYNAITFQTQFDGLNVIGEGFSGPSGIKISVTVNDSDGLVLQHSQFSTNDGYNVTWNYGSMFGGNVTSLSLLTHSDNTTVVSINHCPPKALPAGTNTSSLPFPHGPQNVTSALVGLPNQIQSVIEECQFKGGNSTLDSRSYDFLERRTSYGIAPKFDNTATGSSCVFCLAEATAAAVGCGVACAASFGFACACVAGIPLLYIQCHNPGTGLGQGCCPVGCGSGMSILGIQVVYSCCSSGESCVNPSTGACCASGLQPCGGDTCCPSNAPCRDGGICCPTNQNTCITSSGPTCCNEGEDCVEGTCCPPDSIVNGKCCLPDSETCCTGNPPSKCSNGGIMTCTNNQWVFSTCPYPETCQNIPVQGAGVYCVGSEFCDNGQPSYCDGDGYQSCVNGRWTFTQCKPPTFCTPFPVQGAGVGCVGPP